MIKFLAWIAMALASPAQAPAPLPEPTIAPTVNLDAVRYLFCVDKEGNPYTGSAFLIGDGILATANHVAVLEKCMDVATKTRVTAYYLDSKHDFALMKAPGLPTNIPYIRYRCNGIKPQQWYLSFGITDYQQEVPILRMNTLRSTNDIVRRDDAVEDFPHSTGMIVFKQPIAPGMSGGPVTDLEGYAVAVNNAGNGKVALLFDLKDTVLCK